MTTAEHVEAWERVQTRRRQKMAKKNRQDFSHLEERYDQARAELEEAKSDQWHDEHDAEEEDGTWENYESDTEDLDG